MNKELYYFKLYRNSNSKDDVYWFKVFQSGFWWKQEENDLIIFFPETLKNLKEQKKFPWDLVDWLFNFLFIPIFGIHGGFLFQFLRLRKSMKTLIKSLNISKIIIVGYSQGAGVGLIASLYLAINRYDVKGYGYAGPRVFGWIWWIISKIISLNWTRIQYGGDVVTKLPPFIFGFVHLGNKIHMNKKFWPKFKDHFPSAYENALKEL